MIQNFCAAFCCLDQIGWEFHCVQRKKWLTNMRETAPTAMCQESSSPDFQCKTISEQYENFEESKPWVRDKIYTHHVTLAVPSLKKISNAQIIPWIPQCYYNLPSTTALVSTIDIPKITCAANMTSFKKKNWLNNGHMSKSSSTWGSSRFEKPTKWE